MTGTNSERVRRLAAYKVRLCRWLNHCCLCDEDIRAGQEYHDGGYGRRAHVLCVDKAARELAKPEKEAKP